MTCPGWGDVTVQPSQAPRLCPAVSPQKGMHFHAAQAVVGLEIATVSFIPMPHSPTYAKTTIPHTLHDHCIPASAIPCHTTPHLAMVCCLMSWVQTIPASFCVKIHVSPVRPTTPSTLPHPMHSHACFSTLNHFLLKCHMLCISLDSVQPAEHTRGTRRCLGDTFLTLFVASTSHH